MKSFTNWFLLLAGFLSLIVSCKDSDEIHVVPPQNAKLEIYFRHYYDTVPLALDSLAYTTDEGILFKVTDLQYFISKVTLHLHGGGSYVITSNEGIHYTDLRLPYTLSWLPADNIPKGTYDSISFTFGLDEFDNQSNRYTERPEKDMFWPEILGGGYHYMKLNTAWKDCCSGELTPFMMHLGIGQTYSSVEPNTDSITGYVQNYFTVNLPSSSFTADSTVIEVNLFMQIDRWFNGPPNSINPRDLPAGIMQNEEAMRSVCENGKHVFRCEME